MKKVLFLLAALLVVLMINAVSAADEVVASAPVSTLDSEEQQAMNLIARLRGNVRGSGATCRFDNTNESIKTFTCDLSFEKKILVKKIKVSAQILIVANLATSTVNIKISTGGRTIYNKDYAMGIINLPPFCVDIISDVGFCLQLKNLRFNTVSPGCVAIDLDGYFNAFGFKENVLKQPIGWNTSKC